MEFKPLPRIIKQRGRINDLYIKTLGGGFTAHTQSLAIFVPTSGYQVGGATETFKDGMIRGTEEQFGDYVRKLQDLDPPFIGSWKVGRSVKAYYEIEGCDWIADRGEAWALAVKREQKAIYDWENLKPIYLDSVDTTKEEF